MSKSNNPAMIAAALLAVLSVLNMATLAIPAPDDVPVVVIYSTVVLGVLGLVAAYCLWRRQRLGLWLAIPVIVLNILLAVPGVFFAPGVLWKVLSLAGVVLFAVNLVYLLRRPTRAALAA